MESTLNKKYKTLIKKLKITRIYQYLTDISISFFDSLFFAIITAFILTLVEYFFNGDKTFRLALFVSLFAVWGFTFLGISFPTLIKIFSTNKRTSLDRLAFEIGQRYDNIKDKLSNSLQLFEGLQKSQGVSRTFIEKAFEKSYEESNKLDFSVIVRKKDFQKSLIRSLSALLAFFLIYFTFSSFGFAFDRIVNYHKSFVPPPPFSLIIYPKFETVRKGDNVRISVKATGTPPKNIRLMIKEIQQKDYEPIPLTTDSGNVFTYQLPSIKTSIKFFGEADWINEVVTSDIGEIAVIDYPLVISLNGNIFYPSYTNKPPVSFTEQNADLSVLKGSRIGISALFNKKIKEARVVYIKETKIDPETVNSKIDTFYVNMNVNDKVAVGSFIASHNGSYFIQVVDYDNLSIINPLEHKIIVNNDEYPEVKLLEPETDVKVSEGAILPLMAYIYDDFGFSGLYLKYRLSKSDYSQGWKNFKTKQLPLQNDKNESYVPYIWDLNELNISPSDEYEFYLEIFDNDKITGPKSAKTQILRVRLPSLEEALAEATSSQQSISKELEKALKQANEVKQEMEQIQRELKQERKSEFDWNEKKRVESLLNKQKELSSKLSEVQKNLEELTNKMAEQNLLSPETLQKYIELKKLLQEVNSPELRKLQQELERALQRLSPEEIKKALENYKFDEEQFRKNLERTIKILKRLQAEQKADALYKKAEELFQKQEELQKQVQNSNPEDQTLRNELSKKQDQLQKELQTIDKELKNLEELMKEFGAEMPLEMLKEAMQQLDADATNSDMQEAENSLQSGNFNKAQNFQERAKKRLQKFAQGMKKVKDEISNRVTKEAIKKMQKALNDILTIIDEQVNLKKNTSRTDYQSAKFPELARSQTQLTESLIDLANSLFELSLKSFSVTPDMGRSLGEALNSMQSAVESLAERNLHSAQQYQDQALKSLNNTAMQIQSMLSQMQNSDACENPSGMGSGGKGNSFNFMQRLQEIASTQQMINQMAQQLANQNQGQLSQEQQAQLARLVADQGRAQKALEELANEQKKFTQRDPRILGNLNKILQEMQEVVSDLQSGNINPETLKKQERILSRLLDATKSVYERDFEERRESRPGKELPKDPPPALDIRALTPKTFQQFMNEIRLKYSKDFEEIIRNYFLLIQSNNLVPNRY
ncbi:MAG: DUF4175 family protein [Ignavibacteria bacterium]|nr:DUF4175 family protein [Ignavibacteria bacterium]